MSKKRCDSCENEVILKYSELAMENSKLKEYINILQKHLRAKDEVIDILREVKK